MDDRTRQRVAVGLKWGGGLLALAVVSPLAFLALKGLIGMAAVGVAAFAGLVVIKLAPAVSLRLTNLSTKMVLNEIKRNPVESMIDLRSEKLVALNEQSGRIVEFQGRLESFAERTQEFSQKYPAEAPTYQKLVDQMRLALKGQKEKYSRAQDALELLDQKIEKGKAIWDMALAARGLAQLSGKQEARVFEDIRQQVALDSIQTQLHSSFAELDMSVADASRQLEEVKEP